MVLVPCGGDRAAERLACNAAAAVSIIASFTQLRGGSMDGFDGMAPEEQKTKKREMATATSLAAAMGTDRLCHGWCRPACHNPTQFQTMVGRGMAPSRATGGGNS